MQPVLLVPIAPVNREMMPALAASLAAVFHTSVEVFSSNGFDPTSAFDFGRNQYNSTSLISEALRRFDRTPARVLCITDLDLFVPVLTFVFGEAQLDGKVAVLSTFRLKESLYGLAENQQLLEERLLKESVHELGHTYGLVHCRGYKCVMHTSTSVEEIDIKSSDFCESCKERLLKPVAH